MNSNYPDVAYMIYTQRYICGSSPDIIKNLSLKHLCSQLSRKQL